jgi:signal transduction histidine kinase
MGKPGAAVVAWVLCALTIVVEAVAVGLSWGYEPAFDTIAYAANSIVLAVAGALIVERQPRNRIGALFLGFALLGAVTSDLAQGWGLRAAAAGWPGGPFAELMSTTSWLLSGFGWILTFLLFPDGRLPAPRWRPVLWAGAAGVTLASLGWSLSPDRVHEFAAGVNPFAVTWLPTQALVVVGMTLLIAALVLSATSLVVRFRRASGEIRQQLKWIVAAATVVAVALPATYLLWYVTPLATVLATVALMGLPLATCVSILRYRLYGIDLIIDRTVVYGTVTVLLAAAYGLTTVVLGSWLGEGSGWVIAVATLVAAVAFRPLRDRVQDRVDRRFHRKRYDAVQGMTVFLDRVRVGDAPPELVQTVLREITGDAGLRLLIHLPASKVFVDIAGESVGPPIVPPTGAPDHIVLDRDGLVLAVVVPGTAAPDPALLRRVVDAGGLAIEITRLNLELRRQLTEVEASRTRIVQAATEERRRLERDLHDGAQQRLVAIGLALRHAQHQMRTGAAPDAAHTMDQAVTEIAAAIDDLRELARGLPPAQLDGGLAPAFRDLARRVPIPVDLRAPDERFEPGLEGTAYFIGCEGVTNAVKHARASLVTLRADRHDDRLVVMVTDDGIGGAAPSPGSGLTGLADRVAALGGVLRIDSPAGAGTRLIAELPCGS